MLITICLVLLSSCKTKNSNEDYYMFSYFTGNGEDGLHIAASTDGFSWKALNNSNSFLAPELGNEKLMRDPCIIAGADNMFHMVWTVGWREKGIGYASSTDLVNWSEQKYLPVMEHEPEARNCWAPEITYDPDNKNYVIYWSTSIPGRFPETDSSSEGEYNHRIYYTTTRDFQEFSDTRLLYDKGFNVIDASIHYDNGRYFMLLKDETLYPPEKNIRLAFSKNVTGPFSEPTKPITGNYWAEGPTAVKIGDSWIVYYDKYYEGAFGAVRSHDLENWEDVSAKLIFPEEIRHGSVFRVTKKQFQKLIDY